MAPPTRPVIPIALACLALVACIDFSPGADPPIASIEQAASAATTVCHVPEELDDVELNPRACVDSSTCPCGSRCELGTCVFQCREDRDCDAGEACDPLGRCIASTTTGTEQIPSNAPSFAVSTNAILLPGPNAALALSVTAGSTSVPLIRIVPEPGITVELDPTQPGTNVWIDDGGVTIAALAANTARRVLVRAPATLPPQPTWTVQVSDADHVELVSVSMAPTATAAPTLAGHYTGTLLLTTTGLGTSVANGALAGRSVAIEADIYPAVGGSQAVTVSAPSGLLGYDDQLVGTIAGGSTLSLVSAAQADDVALPVLVQRPTPYTFADGRFSATLTLGVDSTTAVTNPITIAGKLALNRTGDAQGSPRIATPPAAPNPNVLLPWEQVIVDGSDDALAFQYQYSALGLGWSEIACATGLKDQGYPEGDPIYETCQLSHRWIDAWQRHLAALAASPGTTICEWTSPLPVNFVPCGNTLDVIDGGCFAFPSCITPSTQHLNGTRIDGCMVPMPAAASALRDKPLQCSQRYACAATPPVGADNPDLAHFHPAELEFFPRTMVNGDLQCANPSTVEATAAQLTLPQAFGYFTNQNLSSPRRPWEMLQACTMDLLEQPGEDASVADMLQHEGCLDLARALRAMGWAGERARARATGGPAATTAEHRAVDAIFLRFLQQFAETHAFTAREGIEEWTMAEIVRANPADPLRAAAAAVPDLGALLEVERRGWETISHPRTAHALANVDVGVLRTPDYRRQAYDVDRVGEQSMVATALTHQQAVGAPVTLLEAAAAYAELIEADLDAAWRTSDPFAQAEARDRARAGFRQILVGEALAIGTWKRAAAAGPPTWQPQLLIAQRRLSASLGRAIALAEAVATGGNPFGIGPDDLPFHVATGNDAYERYYSMSRSFIAAARTATTNAAQSLTAARNAWDAWRSQTWSDLLADMNVNTRTTEAKERYGREIQQLCGVKGGMRAVDVMETWADANRDGVADVSPDACYLTTAAGCNVQTFMTAATASLETASELDKRLAMCLAGEAFRPWASLWTGATDDRSRLLAFLAVGPSAVSRAHLVTFPTGALAGFVRVSIPGPNGMPNVLNIPTAQFFAPPAVVPRDGEARCLAEFIGAQPNPLANRTDNPLFKAECVQGRIGELAVGVLSHGKTLQQARSQLTDQVERYRSAIAGCLIVDRVNADLGDADREFEATMAELRDAKLTADQASSVFGSIFGFIGSAGAIAATVALGPANLPVMAGVGLAAQGIGATGGGTTNIVGGLNSLELQAEMDEARLHHDLLVNQIERAGRDAQCYHEAEATLIGLDTATLVIDRAWLDGMQAVVSLQNAKDALGATVRDGRAALDREASATMPNLAYEHWIDEAIELHVRDARTMRRLAYLAARAAEYETQTSFAISDEILRATTPDQINRLLLDVELQTGGDPLGPSTRVINVSLCALLGMGAGDDPGNEPVTNHPDCRVTELEGDRVELSPGNIELRRRLLDPANAVYNAAGVYQGQRLTFTLRPWGIHLQSDAAERMWSVAANVKGPAVRGFLGSIELQLRQRNTFSSQHRFVAETPMQTVSVNLLENVMLGLPLPPSVSPVFQTHTIARVSATHDSPGATFYVADDTYAPASRELAGRGPWGEWELFIPEPMLLRGGRFNGLVLDDIRDIELRLSTYSVAKGP